MKKWSDCGIKFCPKGRKHGAAYLATACRVHWEAYDKAMTGAQGATVGPSMTRRELKAAVRAQGIRYTRNLRNGELRELLSGASPERVHWLQAEAIRRQERYLEGVQHKEMSR